MRSPGGCAIGDRETQSETQGAEETPSTHKSTPMCSYAWASLASSVTMMNLSPKATKVSKPKEHLPLHQETPSLVGDTMSWPSGVTMWKPDPGTRCA